MEDISENSGRTVIFVSHNMEAIQRLCTRCILMERGRITVDSDTSSAVEKYLSRHITHAIPNQWIDLGNAVREGTGEARFAALKYSSLCQETGFFPYSDGPIEFLLRIESKKTISIKSLAVTIYSQSGVKLVNADTVEVGQQVHLQKGENLFKLTMENVPLNQGTYVLGLWMDRTGKSESVKEVMDFIEAAFDLEVTDGRSKGFRGKVFGFVTCKFNFKKIS